MAPGEVTPPDPESPAPAPAGAAGAPLRPSSRGTGASTGSRGFGAGTPGRAKAKNNDHSADWDWWWELNDDRFLLEASARRVRATATDNRDGFLGDSLAGTSASISDLQIRRDILPALRAALRDEYYDARAAAAVALARVCRHTVGNNQCTEVEREISAVLADKDRVVQESACLGLGILGNRTSLATLLAIATDSAKGRALAGNSSNSPVLRARAYALVSIGLILGRHSDAADATYLDALVTAASAADTGPDLQVGAILGLQCAQDKRGIPALMNVFQDETRNHLVRASAGVALGKLHAQCAIAALLQGLQDKERAVADSAAIALGVLTPAGDRETVAQLVRFAKKASSRSTRNFCMMALAEIGDAGGRTFLMESLREGQALDRAFAALALGVMSTKWPEERDESGLAILNAYKAEKSAHEKSAMGIALALCNNEVGRMLLSADILSAAATTELQGHMATALSLLNDSQSIPRIEEFASAQGDLVLRRRALIALGAIRDPEVVTICASELSAPNGYRETLGSAVIALGYLGDRRAVPMLIGLLGQQGGTDKSVTRAYAAAALGRLADKDEVPCLMQIQQGANFLAQTPALAELLSFL